MRMGQPNKEMKHLGFFKIESGRARISDPCYDEDESKCAGVLDVKNGVWNSFVVISYEGGWGKRAVELVVRHEDCIQDVYEWKPTKFAVGVDSGQAGVFDDHFFKDDSVVADFTDADRINPDEKICDDEPWYSFCCDRTLSEQRAGIIPFGAVSSTGFGDGVYPCFYHENKDGIIDSIKIVFIEDISEDDDENDV